MTKKSLFIICGVGLIIASSWALGRAQTPVSKNSPTPQAKGGWQLLSKDELDPEDKAEEKNMTDVLIKVQVEKETDKDLSIGGDKLFGAKGKNDPERANSLKDNPLEVPVDAFVSDEELKKIMEKVKSQLSHAELTELLHSEKAEAGNQTRYEWWNKVADCHSWCGAITREFYLMHFTLESKAPHYIFYFPLGKSDIDPIYDPVLRKIKEQAEKDNLVVFVEGRASRTGILDDSHNLTINRELSDSRQKEICNYLKGLGLDETKIKHFFYGYEPPQIGPALRRLLKLDNPSVSGGIPNAKNLNSLEVNQSVIVSLFDPKIGAANH